jgi:hypothetical protein
MPLSAGKKKTLIVCDAQPDVINKLKQPRRFVDLVTIAVQAASAASEPSNVVYTMLQFDEPGYAQVSTSHPRLGVLRRLGAKNPALRWFTSATLALSASSPTAATNSTGAARGEGENETIVTRTTFLPQANDTKLMEILRQCVTGDDSHQFTVIGYGPTVQAICNLLGDVLAIPNVQVLRECVGDENEARRQALLEHGFLFGEEVVSVVDYLEETDLLHERINLESETKTQQPKYVSDCSRGGHISLYMPYLLRDHGYVEWPTQPWYQETKSLSGSTQFNCPLGRRMVDLCDEPQFSRCVRFFLAGRQHLDEKDLLHELVPEFMPPTFDSIESAQAYAEQTDSSSMLSMLWFIKAVNQNGGRAVRVTRKLPTEPLGPDEQLQAHVPRPLLYEHQHKCHVKTYQYIACTRSAGDPSAAVWQVYMHDLFYLSTASRPWGTDDLSDEAQITTMRTHRLYADHPWRMKWNLTEICRSKMQTLIQRAVEKGKLQSPQNEAALQFEVNSADWMLDEDGRVYLIECNGIPVLYDAGSDPPQALVTKGLKLYDRLYKEDPEKAVVNDHDLLKEAIGLAVTGKLPKFSLWKQVASIPAIVVKE